MAIRPCGITQWLHMEGRETNTKTSIALWKFGWVNPPSRWIILIFKLKQWIKNTPLEIKFINIISNYSFLELALSILQNVFLPLRMDQNVSTIIPASVLHTGLETLWKSLSSTTYTNIHTIQTVENITLH